MLNRIWGRTHQRSTTLQAPHLHFSPFGDMRQFRPLSNPDCRAWRLDDPNPNALITLLGHFLLHGNHVRIHIPAGIPLPVLTWAQFAQNLQTDRRGKYERLWIQLNDLFASWSSRHDRWHTSFSSLQEQTFGSVNSLEVTQSILQQLSGANMALFQRVDIHLFSWTVDEYRMIQSHLELASQRIDASELAWLLSPMQLRPEAFTNCTSQSILAQINQLSQHIDDVQSTFHQLRQQLVRLLRTNEPYPDWHHIQQSVNRSTLQSLPDHADIQEVRQLLEHQLRSTSEFIETLGWFSNWTGFQFISFEELDQEVTGIRQRLDRLRRYLPDILTGITYREWMKDLPDQVKSLLKSVSPNQFQALSDSFSCWYLCRWIEQKTTREDWANLSDRKSAMDLVEQLQEIGLEIIQASSDNHAFQERFSWFSIEEQLLPDSKAVVPTMDLYWQCEPPGSVAYENIQLSQSQETAPELNRVISLMDRLDLEHKGDLPAPLHIQSDFWHPNQLLFKRILTVEKEAILAEPE